MKKYRDALFFFVLGVASAGLLLFSAYLGASDECASMGYNNFAVGKSGIYCIKQEEKKHVFLEF